MTTWVTGAGGQVGRHIARLVSDRGKGSYLFLSRRQLDITCLSSIEELALRFRPRCILNLAAYTDVNGAEDSPDLAYRVNSSGVANLAHVAAANRARLIHVSTDYVFDGAKRSPYTEGDPVNPLNTYGATKLSGEMEATSAPEHYIVRTSWVFSSDANSFVSKILDKARHADALDVVTDQYGGPTYARHLGSALLDLLGLINEEETLIDPGLLHFCGEPFVSRAEFAEAILNVAFKTGKLSRLPVVNHVRSASSQSLPIRPENSRLLTSQVFRNLGVERDWRTALADCVGSHRFEAQELVAPGDDVAT